MRTIIVNRSISNNGDLIWGYLEFGGEGYFFGSRCMEFLRTLPHFKNIGPGDPSLLASKGGGTMEEKMLWFSELQQKSVNWLLKCCELGPLSSA